MKTSQTRLSLTRRYILALSFVALLSVSAFLTLQAAIRAQEKGAAEINVAGRQRMLSQRISRFSLLLVISNDTAERETIRKTLTNDINLFEQSHLGLINGGNVRGLDASEILLLPGLPSDTVSKMYFGELALDKQVTTFISEARSLLNTSNNQLALDNPHLQYILTAAAKDLLAGLNAVTGQYQVESEAAIARLEYLEGIVLAATLLTLLGEALLIFRPMVQQIETHTHELEESLQMAELQNAKLDSRSRQVNLSANVSRSLSTILDQEKLVVEVVEQIRSTFNYYHVHIYLVNESGTELLMAGGTGEAGKIMLARNHKVSVGKGLVGQAAEKKSVMRAGDTSQDPGWLENPLLPETRSEIAVPITFGEKVIGVLDVQQNKVNGLGQEDADLLQSLAYQIAVALQNAQIYSQTQQQAKHEVLINEINKKIQNTSSIDQALQVTVRELGLALGAHDTRAVIQMPGKRS